MALYESTFIANQELTSGQVNDLVQNFVDFLKHAKGKLVRKEYWGVKNFAYPIKKQKKGHYMMLCVDCPEDAITSFGNKIKTQEEVLKHFAVRVDAFSKEPSGLAKSDKDKKEVK
jgi:small subunit ribosomal protein S6